jgi:hypothetical protein
MSPDFEPGLVSVIIPTYNRAHMIGETLESVFAQIYRPIEIIVVELGSGDKSVGMSAPTAPTDARKGSSIGRRKRALRNGGRPDA